MPGLMVVGVVGGALFGGMLGSRAAPVELVGEVFIRMLRMLVVPLIITSVIGSVASLGDVRQLGRTGLATLAYYVATTFLAVILGVVLVELLQPGVLVEPAAVQPGQADPLASAAPGGAAREIILSLFHPNLIQAMSESKMLPLIFFSLVFGACVTTVAEEKAAAVVAFTDGVFAVLMKLVTLVMWFAPIGLFGLIGGQFAQAGGAGELWQELAKIGRYFVTVVIGLTVHGLLVLPAICYFAGGRNPVAQIRAFGKAMVAAFGTASSSATLPLTVDCAINEAAISPRIANFVLPVGATINMDGTALYEAVAAIFIAQVYGVSLGLGQTLIVVVTATLAAIGAAGIPHAGLFTMVVVLTAVGLPIEGTALLLSVDWLLDRFRTTVNVWGDAVGATVLDSFEKGRDTGAR